MFTQQFLSNIITGNEAWVYCMTHKPSKSQQKTPSPHPKKARHVHWNVTGTLPPSIYSIIHYEFHKDEVSTNITTLTPYCICDEMCTGNHLRCGIQGTGFSTLTTHLHTLLWLCVHFSLKTKRPSFHTSLLARFSALWQHTHIHCFDCARTFP